ncbi:MAG: hypothetical protein HY902_15840 [Deltaproteobacteria bacterium]|nr:hypothetical protein [Deltaproteobacteria bacterium]
MALVLATAPRDVRAAEDAALPAGVDVHWYCELQKVDAATCQAAWAHRQAQGALLDALYEAAEATPTRAGQLGTVGPSPSTVALWKAARLSMIYRDPAARFGTVVQLMDRPDGPARAWPMWAKRGRGFELRAMAAAVAEVAAYPDWDEDGRADFAALDDPTLFPWTRPLYALALAAAPTEVMGRLSTVVSPQIHAAVVARERFRQAVFGADELHRAVAQHLDANYVGTLYDYGWAVRWRMLEAWVERHPQDDFAPDAAALALRGAVMDRVLSLREVEAFKYTAARDRRPEAAQFFAEMVDPPSTATHVQLDRLARHWLVTWSDPGPWTDRWRDHADVVARRDESRERVLLWWFWTRQDAYRGPRPFEAAVTLRTEFDAWAARHPGPRWRSGALRWIAGMQLRERTCCAESTPVKSHPSCRVAPATACDHLRAGIATLIEARELAAASTASTSLSEAPEAFDVAKAVATLEAEWLTGLGAAGSLPIAQVPPRSGYSAQAVALAEDTTPSERAVHGLDVRVEAWIQGVERAAALAPRGAPSGPEQPWYGNDSVVNAEWQAVVILFRAGQVARALEHLTRLAGQFSSENARPLLRTWQVWAAKGAP